MNALQHLLTMILSLAALTVYAQDAVKANPQLFKVLAENDKVRVLEVKAKKGDKAGVHSHPPMVIYVLKPGKVRFTNADGTVTESKSKAGDVILRDQPVTHSQEHPEASHAIVVELKQ